MISDFKVDDTVTSLLDCINRPFDYHPDGRVPDGNPNSTIQLLDYYDDNGVTTPLGNPNIVQEVNISAVCVVYMYGVNTVRDIAFDITTCEARAGSLYGPIYFFLDDNGAIATLNGIGEDDVTTAQAAFWSNDPVNLATIVGTDNGYEYNSSMTNALRVLSAGVRMWPTIELITDSSTLAVSRYYGCQMTAASIYNAFVDGSNIYSIIRNSPSYIEFSNSQGISGRFQPHQQGSVLKPLHLNALANIANSNLDTSGLYFPVVLARTTSTQLFNTGASINYVTFPVRTFFRTMLEGSLTQPTPLQATRMPYVSEWEDKVSHLMYRTDLYPTIVSGHSFKKVVKSVVDALGSNAEVKKALVDAQNTLASLKKAYKSTLQPVVKEVRAIVNNKGLTKSQKRNLRRKALKAGKQAVSSTAERVYRKVVQPSNINEANTLTNPLTAALNAFGSAQEQLRD